MDQKQPDEHAAQDQQVEDLEVEEKDAELVQGGADQQAASIKAKQSVRNAQALYE